MQGFNPCEPWSFRQAMEDSSEGRYRVEPTKFQHATKRRKAPVEWWPVALVAAELEVSSTRVKALAKAGRFGKCRRPRTGKGRPWMIPVWLQPGGEYRPRMTEVAKGPKLKLSYALSQADEEVPF